jgi:hypothetical protein
MFDLGNTQKTFIAKTPKVVHQQNKPEQRKVGLAVTTVKTAVAGKAVNGRKGTGKDQKVHGRNIPCLHSIS